MRLSVIILSSLLTASLLLAIPAFAKAADKDNFAAEQLLIKFKPGNESKGLKAVAALGARVLEKLSAINVSKLGLPKNLSVKNAVKKLTKLPFVDFAEPDYIFKPSWKTSDPKWDKQWGITKIKTPAGWRIETGDRNVTIAIIDTGVDLNHPDLKNKLVPGHDFIDNDNTPNDDNGGHGTHCAGIAAASTNNGIGVAGVCAECSIMPIRVMNDSGGVASNVARGILWATDHGAKVISMSLGGQNESQTQRDAINYAWNKGVLVVVSAGNNGQTAPFYPAYQNTCIAVGASTPNDTRTSFSNHGSWVDVAAPGSYIMSTVPGGKYKYMSGTSMAAPFVAGLAGLLWSKLGKAGSNKKVRSAIENSCDNIGGWIAKGRINVARALSIAQKAKTPVNKPKQTHAKKTYSTSFSPKGYTLKQGSTIKAPSNSLVKSDGNLLIISSTKKGKRRNLDFYVWTRIKYAQKITKLKIDYEGKFYASSAPVTVYLWDWTRNKWDWIGQKTLHTTITKTTFERSNPTAYVNSNGDIRARFTAQTNLWSTFELGSDQIRFHASK